MVRVNCQNLEGPTRKLRHATAFLARKLRHASGSRIPLYTLKAFFRHASAFKTHQHAVYHCLKEVQKPFWHASAFKTHVSTCACLVAQPLDPPYRAIGYSYTYRSYVFQVSQAMPPEICPHAARGGFAGGITAQAALWTVSRYAGVSLR